MKAERQQYNGVLLLDKPTGISSHDAVAKVRRITCQKGTGHSGTLDPLAEGLLVLCLGRATKIVRFLSDAEKTYEAAIRFGIRSSTYDAEGVDPDIVPSPVPEMSRGQMLELLEQFTGQQKQAVPPYSAVRVNGRRLYKMARGGEEIAEPPVREVNIPTIDLLEYDLPRLVIRVTCSKGTYIRSLAHDIGERLGCGAYLASLRRTEVDRFRIEDAMSLSEVADYHTEGTLESRLLPIEDVLDFSAVRVSDTFSRLVLHGRPLAATDVIGVDGDFVAGEHILLKDSRGTILAVGTAGASAEEFGTSNDQQLFSYERVLH